ncbi:hypothetical protein GpartN1_g5884.t1 [Galdieria partita]|uniref:Uncharacterized protein n=1 Tax=Galdieria partita TaxID=83374 RepID=A0A9C7UNK7_9RHOD|nr:hypothetical protein GpartN1_g1417.t1 [Galdieria partita]GJQ14093.1 hypothetical protein GpartN1_g5884.t1 [Galdieria partita]
MPSGQLTRHSEAWQLISALEDLSLPVKRILQPVENEDEIECLASEQELSERLEWLFLDNEIAEMLRYLIRKVKDNQIVPLLSRQTVDEGNNSLTSEPFKLSSGKEETIEETRNIDRIQKRQLLLQLFKDRVQELEKKKEQLSNLLSVSTYKSKQTLPFSTNQESHSLEGNISKLDRYLCNLSRSCSSFEYFTLDLIDTFKMQRNTANFLKGSHGNEWSVKQSLQQFYTQAKKIEVDIQNMQSKMIHMLTSLHIIHATQQFLVRRDIQSNNAIDHSFKRTNQPEYKKKQRTDLEQQVIQLAMRNIRLQVRQKVQRCLEESYKMIMNINQFCEQHLLYKKVQICCLKLILRIASTRQCLLEDIRSHFEVLCQWFEKQAAMTEDLECHLSNSNGVQLTHMMEKLYQNTMNRISKLTGCSMSTLEDIFQFVHECKKELDDANYNEQSIVKDGIQQMEEIEKQMKQLLGMLQGAYIWERSQHDGQPSYSQRINLLENKTTSVQQDVDDILTAYAQQREFQKSFRKDKPNMNRKCV